VELIWILVVEKPVVYVNALLLVKHQISISQHVNVEPCLILAVETCVLHAYHHVMMCLAHHLMNKHVCVELNMMDVVTRVQAVMIVPTWPVQTFSLVHVNAEPIQIYAVETSVFLVILHVILLAQISLQAHVNVEPIKILAVENYVLLAQSYQFALPLVLISPLHVTVENSLMDAVMHVLIVISVMILFVQQ